MQFVITSYSIHYTKLYEFLQRDILKGKWNFDGFVITDWASIREMINWGFVEDGTEASLKAVEAGADMDMESHLYVYELAKLVREGKVDEKLIDDAVRRILRVKFGSESLSKLFRLA